MQSIPVRCEIEESMLVHLTDGSISIGNLFKQTEDFSTPNKYYPFEIPINTRMLYNSTDFIYSSRLVYLGKIDTYSIELKSGVRIKCGRNQDVLTIHKSTSHIGFTKVRDLTPDFYLLTMLDTIESDTIRKEVGTNDSFVSSYLHTLLKQRLVVNTRPEDAHKHKQYTNDSQHRIGLYGSESIFDELTKSDNNKNEDEVIWKYSDYKEGKYFSILSAIGRVSEKAFLYLSYILSEKQYLDTVVSCTLLPTKQHCFSIKLTDKICQDKDDILPIFKSNGVSVCAPFQVI